MSMEHRAFIFDTKEYGKNLNALLLKAGSADDVDAVKEFIEDHIDIMKSPYSGEALDDEWEAELEVNDIQEVADFALTAYYEPDDDVGLAYVWEAVIEALKAAGFKRADYCVLGNAIKKGKFCVDPGRCGLGLVQAEDVPKMYESLLAVQTDFEAIDVEDLDLDDDVEQDELTSAFEDLVSIYKTAADENKGILFTF